MTEEPTSSPYRALRLNAFARARPPKRKDRERALFGGTNSRRLPRPGHVWDDKATRVVKAADAQVCRRCRKPRFAVENDPCIKVAR